MGKIKYKFGPNKTCETDCPFEERTASGMLIRVGTFFCHKCLYFIEDDISELSVLCKRLENFPGGLRE